VGLNSYMAFALEPPMLAATNTRPLLVAHGALAAQPGTVETAKRENRVAQMTPDCRTRMMLS
jgi:hypothetical protein